MSQEFKIAKGVKDWYGKEAMLRNIVRDKLRKIFERYGYSPIETPIMENIETLGYKGGGEIQKEVFRLKDQGERELALRFDHTVPLARFYSSHPELKLPFKRYAIGEVFRDGPTQPDQGRYRSFTQCDIDVLGIKGMTAEMELFCLARDAFKDLDLGEVDVKINNRKILDGIIGYAGVPEHIRTRTIINIDKIDKIGIEGVSDALKEMRLYDPSLRLSDESLRMIGEDALSEGVRRKITEEIGVEGMGFVEELLKKKLDKSDLVKNLDIYSYDGGRALTEEQVDKIVSIINIPGSNMDKYLFLKDMLPENEGLEEIKEIIEYSKSLKLNFIKFDPSLARGLDYYTGTTLEVYLKDDSIIKSAIAAGGRFDNMVGDFAGKDIPAVGMSFGLERLVAVMEKSGKYDAGKEIMKSATEIYVIPIGGHVKEALSISQKLREYGLNTDMNHGSLKKIGDAIAYANNQGIKYVGFVGENEIKSNSLMIKNLENGRQENIDLDEVKNYLK